MGTLTLRLSDEMETALAERAGSRGLSTGDHLRALLEADLAGVDGDARRRWAEENRAGIEDWNERVRRGGLPLAHLAVTRPDFGAADTDEAV